MFGSRAELLGSLLADDLALMERLQGALEAVDDTRLNMYNRSIPDLWRQPDNDAVARILEYLRQARNNSAQLFQKVREVLL